MWPGNMETTKTEVQTRRTDVLCRTQNTTKGNSRSSTFSFQRKLRLIRCMLGTPEKGKRHWKQKHAFGILQNTFVINNNDVNSQKPSFKLSWKNSLAVEETKAQNQNAKDSIICSRILLSGQMGFKGSNSIQSSQSASSAQAAQQPGSILLLKYDFLLLKVIPIFNDFQLLQKSLLKPSAY